LTDLRKLYRIKCES